MTAQQALAFVRLLVVLAVIAVVLRNRCVPRNLMYSAPILGWMGFSLVYLVAYLIFSYLGRVDVFLFNVLSASAQLLGLLTIFVMEFYRYSRQKDKREKQAGGKIGC